MDLDSNQKGISRSDMWKTAIHGNGHPQTHMSHTQGIMMNILRIRMLLEDNPPGNIRAIDPDPQFDDALDPLALNESSRDRLRLRHEMDTDPNQPGTTTIHVNDHPQTHMSDIQGTMMNILRIRMLKDNPPDNISAIDPDRQFDDARLINLHLCSPVATTRW